MIHLCQPQQSCCSGNQAYRSQWSHPGVFKTFLGQIINHRSHQSGPSFLMMTITRGGSRLTWVTHPVCLNYDPPRIVIQIPTTSSFLNITQFILNRDFRNPSLSFHLHPFSFNFFNHIHLTWTLSHLCLGDGIMFPNICVKCNNWHVSTLLSTGQTMISSQVIISG